MLGHDVVDAYIYIYNCIYIYIYVHMYCYGAWYTIQICSQCSVEARQAFGPKLLDFLVEDPFRRLLKMGLESKEPLVEWSCLILRQEAEREEWPQSVQEAWKTPAVEPLRTVMGKVEQLSRAILHFFCEEVPEPGAMAATTDHDVFHFTNYSGQGTFEKAIRRAFTEANSFWAAETQEIISKGASNILGASKVKELEECLAEEPSWSTLRQSLSLLKEVRQGARSQKVASILKEFSVSWL